jgi:hypothetical protein
LMPSPPPRRGRMITPAQAYVAGVPDGNPYHAGNGEILIARAPRQRVRAAGRGRLFYLAAVWVQVLRRMKADPGAEPAAAATPAAVAGRTGARALPH